MAKPNVNGLYVVWYIDLAFSIVHMATALAKFEHGEWYNNKSDPVPFLPEVMAYEGPLRTKDISRGPARRIPLDDYTDVE